MKFLLKYGGILIELTKPGIAVMALAMGVIGFFLGTPLNRPVEGASLFWALVGMALVGACSGALNQLLEIDQDSRMDRTKDRPLPSKRIERSTVFKAGLVLGLMGEFVLLVFVNPVTAVLGAVTLLFYLGVYTPSKSMSSTSTLIGAIPGALPPLMGYTAATGVITEQGLVLFSLLFLWQIPHFLAIAWIYQDQYRKADYPVLPVVDPLGRVTSGQIILYSLALICVSLLPSAWGFAGKYYFLGALVLGALFLFASVQLTLNKSLVSAKTLFRTSLVYLPVLGALLVWDRIY